MTRLKLLLQEIEKAIPRIRIELPGWHPSHLRPELEAALKALEAKPASLANLDVLASKLADVLRKRPETADTAAGLPIPCVEDKSPLDQPEVANVVYLDRVCNECKVLVCRIIEELQLTPPPGPPPPPVPQQPRPQ